MYIVLVYDVSQKRCGRVAKCVKKYLYPAQKSVFEGRITAARLKQLKGELSGIIDKEKDSIIIYRLESTFGFTTEEIGKAREISPIVI